MRSRTTQTLLATLVATFMVSPAFAKPPGGPGGPEGHEGGRFIEKMTKDMNLTPEQQEKLKKIHEGAKGEMKAKKEAMRKAGDDLEEALKGTATDEDIRAKFTKLQSLQDEFAKARFEKVLSVRAILTPEQRKSFKGMGPHGEGGPHWRKHHGPPESGD